MKSKFGQGEKRQLKQLLDKDKQFKKTKTKTSGLPEIQDGTKKKYNSIMKKFAEPVKK